VAKPNLFLKLGQLKNRLKNKKSDQASDLASGQTTDFFIQKDLDKKLVYSLNSKKIPSLKQIKYLPRVLDAKQLKQFRIALALIGLSFIFLIGNFYFRNFLPTPVAGGEYVEGLIGAPQYINPLLSQTNDVDSDIARLVFSGLLKYDKDLQLVLDLAEKYEVSEDKKTYTFTLKNNLKWHDGQPLVADDVIFTFQSVQDKDFKSPLLVSWRGVQVQKVDDKTIKFILPDVYPSFLDLMTTGILPEHTWAEIPPLNANLTEYNLKPIGSGPWKFKTLTKDRLGNIKSYVLIPNPDFYGPKPYLQKLTFKFYPDFESAIEAAKSHAVEGISFLPKKNKADLQSSRNLKLYSFDLPQYTAVFFNQKQNAILKDKNVRLALALATDKQNILTEALRLEGKIIDGPILPFQIDLSDDKKIKFDLAAANKLLDEGGWKQITTEEYLKMKEEAAVKNQATSTPTSTDEVVKDQIELVDEGSGGQSQAIYRLKKDQILEINLVTVNQPENIKTAELLRSSWQNIGVKVNLEIIDSGKIVRDIIKPRNYQVLLFGIIVGTNPDPSPFWHSSQVQDPGLNLALLSNREADKLLEDAKKAEDIEKQKQDYIKFQDLLTEELPAIFLFNPTYTYVIYKNIQGIDTQRVIVPADRFNNLSNWYLKTKRVWQGKFN